MSGFKHLERIDAYLDGRLDGGDRQRFEADLLIDAELKAEYDACLASDDAIELMAFRGMLKHIREEEIADKSSQNDNFKWGLFALALLIGALIWWFSPNRKEHPVLLNKAASEDSLQQTPRPLSPVQDSTIAPVIVPKIETKTKSQEEQQRYVALAKSLYEPVGFSTVRGNDALLLDSASVAFDGGQFRLAIKLASSVKKGENGYAQARRVTAHASFQLGDYVKAATIFEELTAEAGDAGKTEESYLLLSWLAAGKAQTAEFKSLLEKIKSDKWHPFHKKALKIN